MHSVTWVLESSIFPKSHPALRAAITAAGQQIVEWEDEWWSTQGWSHIPDSPAIFHGSLANAARIACELPWTPGAWCNAAAFRCSAWYDVARPWLLHRGWTFTTVEDLTRSAKTICDRIDCRDRVFVRPDSPLKPFSGRVLAVDSITLRSLDHGFYYDDLETAVVIAPVADVKREWRFVIADCQIVGTSSYDAGTRSKGEADVSDHAVNLAATIAAELPAPEPVYVMDICESRGECRLLELNPFSGADLYAAPSVALVNAIDDIAVADWTNWRGC